MTTPFIQIERTPNPEALRILPGIRLLDGAPIEVRPGEDVSDLPIAAAVLAVGGLDRILIGDEFVTAVRAPDAEPWEVLKPRLLAAVADFLLSGQEPVLLRTASESEDFGGDLVASQIHQVIQRFVRPMLARDGGEATLMRFDADSGIAYIRMGGACGGCPSDKVTLKRGIERTIKRYVPEVTEVRADEDPAQAEADPKARFRAWVAARFGPGAR